jgi:hypothetical protein
MVTIPHKMCTGIAILKRCRLIGTSFTRWKISGVNTAHGSQSLIPGQTASSHRLCVLPAASTPIVHATIVQQAKLIAQSLAIGGNLDHSRTHIALCVFIVDKAETRILGWPGDQSMDVQSPLAY